MMKRKFYSIGILTILLSAIFVFSINATEEIEDLQNRVEDNESKINNIKSQISEINGKKKTTADEIAVLDLQIQALQLEKKGYDLEIEKLSKMIDSNKNNMVVLTGKIEDNNLLLERRLRASYKNGGVAYLELIFDSDNIVEAMTRLDMIQLIIKDDVELLKSIEQQKTDLNNLLEDQKKKQARLEEVKTGIIEKSRDIENAQREKEAYMANLESNIEEMEAMEARLQEANKNFEEQIKQKQLEMEYAGGEMTWPVPGHFRITSPYGKRIHPLYGYQSFHRGIDIGCYYNTEVVAANSGVVIVAGWHYSYGNYIIIDHGGGISTVYGHNTKLLVKAGDKVKKGQVISLSGSTGESTGPHLHFEVRVNASTSNPMDYLK